MEFQPVVGGKVLEHLSNGQVLPWAEVLVWEPPTLFVLAWKPNSNANPPTEVEVRFTPQADGTLVELEHRGWERLGEIAPRQRGRLRRADGVSTSAGSEEAADREVA